MSPEERKHERHSVALWAALATFFTSFASVNLLILFGVEDNPGGAAAVAVVTGAVAALAVYARERLNDAKRERDT